MTLTPGTRLGPYEIVAPLGAGGMGEVYRARDTRLSRDVAVKVLPQHLSASPEVRARFEREAKTISQLNHPHICTLHDVGREGDTDYLVMELVEGETLAQRLERGALPLPQALKLGVEIADALDRAHRAGVVHRDLKPGNVMLTKLGAKLMDFGLARLTGLGGPAGQSDVTLAALTRSPTMAQPLTAEGTIVGTFQYMAPEQLEGKDADARCDLWALGCVLYEMATARRAFEGQSQASLIGAILKDEPAPVSQWSPIAPPAFDHTVRRCLAKDPDERWQTARDLAHELRGIAEGRLSSTGAAALSGARRPKARLAQGIAAVATLLLVVVTLALWRERAAAPALTAHLEFVRPANSPFAKFGQVQVSPDGRLLVMVADEQKSLSRLWVRPIDSDDLRLLEGTDGGTMPFWSPDSRHIGFFAGGRLKRVSAAGGAVQSLCAAPSPLGGAWGSSGVIVFEPDGGSGLSVIPEGGGAPKPLTSLLPREEGHRWPSFLPDGRHVIFLGDARRTEDDWLRLASIDGGPTQDLMQAVTNPVFVAPDWLLYVRSGSLVAQRLDPRTGKLSAEPVALAKQIASAGPNHLFEFSASTDGVLTYRAADPSLQLAWFDRQGRRLEDVGRPDVFDGPRLSPDGHFVVTGHRDADGRDDDIWLLDLQRGTSTRLTSDPTSEFSPVWSPDGSRIAFQSYRTANGCVFLTAASGTQGDSLLWQSPMETWPVEWSPDGHWLLVNLTSEKTGDDIWILPMDRPTEARPLITTAADDETPRFSPDGKWLAYASSGAGRRDIYVQDFPEGKHRWQVSTTGGFEPFWSAGGREILYQAPGGSVMSAQIHAANGLLRDAPHELFQLASGVIVGLSTDGQRLLVLIPTVEVETAPLHVVLGWDRAKTVR